ncbi:MAG: copper homeostasis protein CutC [Oscillospiraceae bacterium]|nr:copper homeostasis protein CutC [Oscillospiraceae bacterium]
MASVLEVCVGSAASAVNAQKGGGDRVELCSNLIIGGTSPSLALVKQVKYYTDLKIRVLLRPRFGDFCYDRYELEEMKELAQAYAELGVDAIVTGMLTPDGELDLEAMRAIKSVIGDTTLALHRAFDMCQDPFKTLEEAVSLGVGTILTSGQKNSAWEGRELLKELVTKSAGRIEILAGAGIGPSNIEQLARYTGARAFHMSGKLVKDSRMAFRRSDVSMGLPGFSEYELWETSPEAVSRAAAILRSLD